MLSTDQSSRADFVHLLPPSIQLKILSHLDRRIVEAVPLESHRTVAMGESVAFAGYEQIVQLVTVNGFAAIDGFLGNQMAEKVMEEFQAVRDGGSLRPAGMGQGERSWQDESVRGDAINWMHKDECGEWTNKLLGALEPIREHFSTALKVNLDKSKFQLAHYAGVGARYARHSDAGPKCPDRRITVIYYANANWNPSHGGCIRLYIPGLQHAVDIAPVLDRLLVFRSDFEHEVCPCFESRLALSGWLYCAEPVAQAFAHDMKLTMPTKNCGFTAVEKQMDPSLATIFVSIASYRDPDCQNTVIDLFEKADKPERVFVGICWQCDREEDAHCFQRPSPRPDQTRIEEIHWKEAKGPCYARYLAQKLWNGESHYLQIDSHMRFVQGWDSLLLSMLSQCFPSNNAILTTYPMDFQPPDELPADPRPTLLRAKGFGDDGMLRLKSSMILPKLGHPQLSLFWAAGFAFSTADVINKVPYDPEMQGLFFGEEMTMALRLWTHGFTFFAPNQAVVFHRWSRTDRPTFTEIEGMATLQSRALGRARVLLGCATEEDKKIIGEDEQQVLEWIYHSQYGLGDSRSLQSFNTFCGVDHKNKVISTRATNGGMGSTVFL